MKSQLILISSNIDLSCPSSHPMLQLLRPPSTSESWKPLHMILTSTTTSFIFLFLTPCPILHPPPWLLMKICKICQSFAIISIYTHSGFPSSFFDMFFSSLKRRDPANDLVQHSHHLPEGSHPFQNAPDDHTNSSHSCLISLMILLMILLIITCDMEGIHGSHHDG